MPGGHAHATRLRPVKSVGIDIGPGNNHQEAGENHETVKTGAASLVLYAYGKRIPLRALVHRARRSMRDAMSPKEFRSLHTRRQSLPSPLCGKDRLLLLMVSITLPHLKR
jgi:hypothetical protein